jgi:hypothetical protein
MRSYSQNQPTGSGGDADFFQRILRQLREELQFYDSETIGFRTMPRGILAYQKNPVFGGGPGGWPWMYPTHVEGDSTQFYGKGYCMYISAGSSLISTGMMDLVLNANATACQGVWLAMQDVPAQTSDTPPKWNVPQFPLPITPATPTGSPLKGDLDNPALLWFYMGDVS